MTHTQSWTKDYKKGDHVIHIYDTLDERFGALVDVLEWMSEDEVLIQMSNHWGDAERCIFTKFYDSGRLLPLHPNGGPLDYDAALRDVVIIAKKMGKTGLILAMEAKEFKDFIGSNDGLMRFEVELNLKDFGIETTIMCQYDRSAFSQGQLELAESIHGMKFENGKLERNFWVVYYNYWK